MFYNLFAIFCIIYYFQAFLAFLACLAFSNISSSSIFLGLAASGKDKQSQFSAFFETLKPKCSWVDGTGIFDHLDYRITFILLISCFHIKGRYHYVVNCPTRWSLSFIFVFLCWSTNKYQKYKSVELGDQLRQNWTLLQPTFVKLGRFQAIAKKLCPNHIHCAKHQFRYRHIPLAPLDPWNAGR